jgi:hypothetical protein
MPSCFDWQPIERNNVNNAPDNGVYSHHLYMLQVVAGQDPGGEKSAIWWSNTPYYSISFTLNFLK